jgi:hypothetical protein
VFVAILNIQNTKMPVAQDHQLIAAQAITRPHFCNVD